MILSDKAPHPSLTVWTNSGPTGHAGVAWNRQKQRSSVSLGFLTPTSLRVGFSVPLLANNERVCNLFASRRSPGGSPERNGPSTISRRLSSITPLIPRPIYLLCMRTRVVRTLSKSFLCSSGEIVVDWFSADRICLHILRASNGEAHPKAVMPIIVHPVDRESSFTSLSTCGSQVCLCLGGSYPYDMIVWEWTTGKLIFVSFQVKTTPTR